jgi:hypothetical protein
MEFGSCNPKEFGNNPDNPPHIRDGADEFNQGVLGVKYSENSSPSLDAQQTATNDTPPSAPRQTINELRVMSKPAVPVFAKFVGGRLISPAEAASPAGPPLQGPMVSNPPSEKSAFGNRSENAPVAPPPDSYRQLRRVSSAFAGIAPNEAPPPPERAPLLGIVSGMPMSFSPFPLPFSGPRDNSDQPGNGNLFDFLAGLAPRNPSPAPPAPDTGGTPVRSLGRSIAGQPQASVFDMGAPAAPLAPSEDANFSGGLLGRLTALAGLDPQNLKQPAPPPPLDDQLRGFYRDGPAQPWFAQLQR